MHVLSWLLCSAAVLTVSARHKRDWEFVNMKKISRERLQPFYRSEDPDCSRGVGFYRDPHDCHQYIRCVDDFSTGRQMSIFIGRCRPGLVFDESISNCNWPELTEPCNNTSNRYKETPSKFRPKEEDSQQIEHDNNISGYEDSRNKPYAPPQQIQEQQPQESKFQENESQKQTQQSFEEIQVPQKVKQPQVQEQVSQTKIRPFSGTQQSQKPVSQQRNKIVPQSQQTRRPPVPQSYEKQPAKTPAWQEISQQQKVPQEVQGAFQQQNRPISQTQPIQEQVKVEKSKPSIQAPQVQNHAMKEHKVPPKAHVWKEDSYQQKVQQAYPPASQVQTFQEQDEQEKYEPVSQSQKIQEPINVQHQERIPEKSPVWQEISNQEKVNSSPVEVKRPLQQKVQPIAQAQKNPENVGAQQVTQTQQIREPVLQEKHEESVPQQENVWQEEDQQEKVYQEPTYPKQPSITESNRQQQVQNDENQNHQFEEDISSGIFQEIPDSQEISSSNNKGTQQQVTPQWIVASNNKYQRPSSFSFDNRRRPAQAVPATLDEPIVCKREGFFKHPKDCARFVRCVKTPQRTFSIHFFQCAQSLVFDENESHCVSSKEANCLPRRSKRQSGNAALKCKVEGFFRHPSDCRSFYRCVKRPTGAFETHLFSCPDTLVFDEAQTICNWPDKAPPCGNQNNFKESIRAPAPINKQQFKPTRRTTTQGYKSTNRPRNDFIEKTNPFTSKREKYNQKSQYTTQSSSQRQKDCNRPGFFQHDYDCTKFYKCVRRGNNFVRYELSCPNNFAYDEYTSRCVSLKYSNSCNRINKPAPPRQYDDGVASTTEATTSKSSPPPKADDDAKCVKEGFYRNPNDCNSFYRCVDFSGAGQEFVKYDFKCAEGLVFDEKTSVCNWPDQGNPCVGGSERDTGGDESNSENATDDKPSSISTTTARTTKDDTATSSGSSRPGESTSSPKDSTSTSSKSSNPPGEKPPVDGCNQEGFFRNPEDCNKFYRCVDFDGNGQNFVRYDFACPDGLIFDEGNSVCNWPSESSSCESNGNEGGGNQEGSSTSTTSQGAQDSTTKIQRTTTQTSTTLRTTQGGSTSPPRGQGTDRTTSTAPQPSTTAAPEDSNNSNRGQTGNQCQETGFFRNPEDCNKFYRCVDYNGDGQEFVKYDFACPEGLVFDEKNSVCNWPDQSSPCESSAGEGSTDQGDGSSSSTPQSGQDDRLSSTTTSSTTSRSSERESTGTSRTTKSTQSPPRTESTEGTSRGIDQSSTTPATSVSSTRSDGRQNTGQCQEAGFFRNPEDCNKFYRCVDYNGDGAEFVRYDFACPDGLVFDDENSVCNWPDQTKPCDGSGSKGEGGRPGEDGSGPGSEPESEGNDSESKDKSTTPGDNVSSTQRTTQPSTSEVTDGFTTSESSSTQAPESSSTQAPKPSSTQTPSSATTAAKDTTGSATGQETTTSVDSGGSTSKTSGNGQREGTIECKEAGFFRNPDDCGKFYRCVDFNGDGQEFVRYDFDCPEGLYFDEVNSVCNWPEQTPSCESEPSTGDREGSTITSTADTSSTTKPSKTTDQTSSSATTESGSQQPTQGSTTQTTGQVETSTSSQSSTTIENSDSGCTESGFFRCPEDCTKFYRCVKINESENYTRYNFSCPDGLIFDERNKKCDWPSSELTCEEGTSTSSEESGTSTPSTSSTTAATPEEEPPTTTSGSTTVGDTSTSSSTNAPSSSSNCTEEGFFRNPEDCSKYYRCVDEGDGAFIREDFSCEEDEVFDEEMRYCNREELAPPCNESTSQQTTSGTQGTTESELSSTSTPSTSTTRDISTSTTTSSTTQDSAQSNCTEEGFFRCPEDCTKFYRCVDFEGNGENLVRYNFTCPEGLIFDETNQKCDRPSSELACENEPSSTLETTSSTPSSTGTFPTSGTTLSSECTEEGFFRNPNDCNKYYRCLDEGEGTLTREDFSCGEDEIFDEEMRYCNHKDLATPCDESTQSTTESYGSSETSMTTDVTTSPSSGTSDTSTSISDSTLTTEASTSASTTKSGSSTTNSQSTESSTSQTESESSQSGDCQEEGFHRDPDDCNKFYRCVDFRGDGRAFTRYNFVCPEGLVFDESNSVCNWPTAVPNCESAGRNQSSTTIDDTVNTSTTEDSSATELTSKQSTSSSISTTSSSGSTTTDGEITSSTTSSGGTTASSSGSTSSPSSSSRPSGSIECTEAGFFRHPDDCTKFYRCVDFAGTGESYVRYDFECPDDLVFDEVNSVCNWPNQSPACDSGSRTDKGTRGTTVSGDESSSASTTSSPTSTSRTNDDSSTTQTDTNESSTSSTSDNTPPIDASSSTDDSSSTEATSSTDASDFQCEEEGFFSHPSDCKKFYECKLDEDTGKLVQIDCECPDGHVFDTDGWYCNAEELAPPCDSSSFRCEEEGLFRDPEDCTRYYVCNRTGPGENDFRRQRFECQDGNVFDEAGQYCNAPELAEPCENSSTTAAISSSTSDSSSTTSRATSTSRSTRPASTTSGPNGSTSTTQGESSIQCTREGFFRNPEDCTSYYQCSRNEESGEFERTDYNCPDGRIFDEGVSYCNDPRLSEEPCDATSSSSGEVGSTVSPPSATRGTSAIDVSTTQSAGGGTDSSATSSTDGSGNRRRGGGGDLECTEAGFFRHPKDCNKFYRCVDFAGTGESFVRFDFDCPEGLHFDEVNSVCNWPTMTPSCTSESDSRL